MSEETIVKKQRGGYRGGGRKPAPPTFRRHGILVSDDAWNLLVEQGDGNASRGLEKLAQRQLATQRQEIAPGQLRSTSIDYWGEVSAADLGIDSPINDDDLTVTALNMRGTAARQGVFIIDSVVDYLKSRPGFLAKE